MSLPESLEIEPLSSPLDCWVTVPGSKSISNRVLLISGLARGESELAGVLDSDDTRVMARALQAMGARVTLHGDMARVEGVDGRPSQPSETIDVRASGTAARLLGAALALVPGEVRLDGTARMRERPIAPLCDALQSLGVEVTIEGVRGCPPIVVRGGRPFGGEIEVDASSSSQYVSALLLIAPYATRDITIALRDGVLVSRPYVEVTLDVMRAFGAEPEWLSDDRLHVTAGARYVGRAHTVEPDASSAAYFFAAAAIAGGSVQVPGLSLRSRQADIAFVRLLERMGAVVRERDGGIEVSATAGSLRAFDEDMNAMPDAVLAAAVTALFAEGRSRIRNVGNLRIKETDRLAALERELRKLGAHAVAGKDEIVIEPRPLSGATIATYDDHRMAMAFALVGLRTRGVRIEDPGCVSKSWPGYFDAFARLTRWR